MSTDVRASRGRPVLFAGVILVAWVSVRIVTWETPWPRLLASEVTELAQVAPVSPPKPSSSLASSPVAGEGPAFLPPLMAAPERSPPRPIDATELSPLRRAPLPEDHFEPGMQAAGHNLLWLSAMGGLPVPREVSAAMRLPVLNVPAEAQYVATGSPAKTGRWNADAWLLLRAGGSPALSPTSRPSNYGASQMGAVLTYRLAPGKRTDPSAYARASKALVQSGETEVALGLQARPLAGLPVRAHAEMRATQTGGATVLRPAAFLSGGVDDVPLPLGFQASGYAQAGYVGGDFATGFADGSVRVVRPLAKSARAEFDAGLAAWGGAQRDAARLDVGPTIGVKLDLGTSSARLSADYRLRVAGDAQPASGAALTIIGGF